MTPRNRSERVAMRRRRVFVTGMTALLLCGASLTVLATGCIFDSGSGYEGGGRRTGAPTATDENQGPAGTRTASPTSTGSTTSTSTSTSTSTTDAASLPQDSGAGG